MFFGLIVGLTIIIPALANNSSTSSLYSQGGGSVSNQADTTTFSIRDNDAKLNPAVKQLENYEQSHRGQGPSTDQGGAPITRTITRAEPFPGQPSTYTVSGSGKLTQEVGNSLAAMTWQNPQGYATADQNYAAITTALAKNREYESDPEQGAAAALGTASAMSTSAANSMAGAATSQAMGAIEFTRHYLVNFTAQAGNSWQSLRNNLFIPIAILLLLPGAVLAQVRAIVAQSSPILGEVNPFEGITRSIIAIFMIPASFLVVNYGIDLSNAITHGISSEYQRLFGTDMYQDAECAEMRAFPVNNSSQNMNAFLPSAQSALSSLSGKDPWSSFEASGIANKLFDPCVGLNQSLIPDEASSSIMNVNRLMMNGSNSFLAMTWNIMCAFQTVFLYYLWCMGPIVAALWVWPMERLRSALPSWIEGVITLCFWSLFWNVVVLLIACFRGVSETGTVIMTALNSLAPISVWYAFDFSALISEGAGYSMMNAISQSIGQAAKGAGGGGGGGGGGKQASGGGGTRQASGGGMGPGFMGAPGGSTAAAYAGVPGGGMGSGALGGSGGALAFGGGSTAGGMGTAMGSGLLASGLGGPPGSLPGASGLMPGGAGRLPVLSTSTAGASMGSSNFSSLDSAINNELQNRQMSQRNMSQQQLAQQNEARIRDMQAFQDQARQKQQDVSLADYQNARKGETERNTAQTAAAMLAQQATDKQLQQTNMAQFLQNATPHEQARLATLFNNRLPSVLGSDLPPKTRADFVSADTGKTGLADGSGNILMPGTGLPPVASADLSRAGLGDVAVPGTNASFSAGSLSGPPPVVTTSTSYTTVDSGSQPPEIYTYTAMDGNVPTYTPTDTTYTVQQADVSAGTDPTYRTEQSVGWSNVSDNNMARESITEQPLIQPTSLSQSQMQYTNQNANEQQVQYIPAEIKQERIEVQQVQQPPQQIQETVVHQQQKQAPQPSAKTNADKPVGSIFPVFATPPQAPKPGSISSVLAALGGKQADKPQAGQGQPGSTGNTLSRDSNKPSDEPTKQQGSLAEHLSRLQRGGGRTIPKAKDILAESGLPPQSKDDDEEEKKDNT